MFKELFGYEDSYPRLLFTFALITLSMGVLGLIFYWKQNWFLCCSKRRCKLSEAKKVMLKVTDY